jgi:hypothetical protein
MYLTQYTVNAYGTIKRSSFVINFRSSGVSSGENQWYHFRVGSAILVQRSPRKILFPLLEFEKKEMQHDVILIIYKHEAS